jgi:hypothetical protein
MLELFREMVISRQYASLLIVRTGIVEKLVAANFDAIERSILCSVEIELRLQNSRKSDIVKF